MRQAEKELLEKQMADDTVSASEIDPALVTGYRGIYNRVVKRGLDFVDPRITRVGGFLRKVKLDEFANLLSILGGRMSFIGPRPELADCQGKDKKIFK